MFSVLYVDDEPGLLEIAQIFLEETGDFRVTASTSVREALDSLNRTRFDAIISDYHMPEGDGIAFLKEVRDRFGDIPFILFTGRGREAVVIEAINNGADFYILKGGEPGAQFAELAHKIRQAIRRREAERELRRSEARYRSIVNDQTEMILRFLPDGTITFANQAFRSFVFSIRGRNITTEGVNIRDILGSGDYTVIDDTLMRLVPENPINDVEYRITGSDRNTHWQQWSIRALFDEDGKPAEYQVVGRDITERKSAQEALFNSRQMLQTVLDTIPQRVFWKDKNLVFLGCNKPLAIDAGYENPADMVGRTDYDHASSQTAEIYRADDRFVIETGQPKINFEELQIRADGSTAWLRTSKVPLRNRDGEIFGVLGTYEDITEAKRAEDVLRESEKRYRDLADSLPQMVFETDLDLRITYANRHGLATLQIAEEDLQAGISVFSYIDPSQHGSIWESMERLQSGAPYTPKEYRVVRKDGSAIPCLIYSSPIYRNNTLAGFRGIVVDISSRKVLEDALRSSEEKFRGMAERTSELMLILNRAMSPVYVSPSSRTIIGFEPEELIGQSPEFAMATIFATSGPRLMQGVKATMEGQTVENLELQISRKDKTPVYVSLSAVPVLQGGALTGVQVSMRDITESRNAKEALRASEEKYRLLVETTTDWIWETDLDGIHTYSNPAVFGLLGYTVREVVGTSAFPLLHPDDHVRVRELVAACIRDRDPAPFTTTMRWLKKDGTPRLFESVIMPLADESGNIRGFRGIDRDITERKRAEDALLLANKKLSTLHSITRHDINNQLMALMSHLMLLGDDLPDLPKSQDFRNAVHAAERISVMVRFTQDYEEIGITAPVWQDLHTVVSTVAAEAPLGKVTVTNTLPEGREVYADPLIARVFYNLMDNAARYGGSISHIVFSCEERGSDLVITCEDDGMGIAREEKEQIFERGFGKNTGLGLALSREILSFTGIAIRETGEPGKGARFEIIVPKDASRRGSTQHPA